jgi:hypothetical protein
VRGLENELYGIIFDPVTMASTGLRRLESAGEVRPLAGDPSCITGGVFTALNPNLPLGEMTCGVRGKDNGFYVARFSGTPLGFRTSSIQRLDPNQVIVGDPSCAGTGVVICAARAADSSLAVIRVGAGGFFRLDGPVPTGRVLGDPSCASTEVRPQFIAAGGTVLTSSPLVTCGVRGNDSALYVIRFFIDGFGGGIVGGAFLGEQTLGYDVPTYLGLGGVLTGNPSCASTPFQILTCGMRGHDGNLYLMDVHTVTGSNTGTHDRQTIVIAADPACVTFGVTFGELAQNNVTCGVADLNNGLSTVASVRPAVF